MIIMRALSSKRRREELSFRLQTSNSLGFFLLWFFFFIQTSGPYLQTLEAAEMICPLKLRGRPERDISSAFFSPSFIVCGEGRRTHVNKNTSTHNQTKEKNRISKYFEESNLTHTYIYKKYRCTG
jgi:hypothetical protein